MARRVLDLDGALIDSAPDIHEIANAVLAGEGAEPITLAQAREFIGNGAGVFVAKMRAARGIADSEQERLLADFTGHYLTATDLTHPYPAVEQVLGQLKAAGHSLGVCTNKPFAATQAALRATGLDGYFDVVIGGDSLPVHKPDPRPLDKAFADLGRGPEIYVGDSEVDAETAQRALVPFVLFTEGYRKTASALIPHAAQFSHFDDLGVIIDALLAEAAMSS